MSSATALLRYPDGTVFWGEYDGTVDVMRPCFYPTREEMKAHWHNNTADVSLMEERDTDEDVEVFADYGDGVYWSSRASRSDDIGILTGSRDGYAEEDYEYDGVGFPSKPLTYRLKQEGTPEWVLDIFPQRRVQ